MTLITRQSLAFSFKTGGRRPNLHLVGAHSIETGATTEKAWSLMIVIFAPLGVASSRGRTCEEWMACNDVLRERHSDKKIVWGPKPLRASYTKYTKSRTLNLAWKITWSCEWTRTGDTVCDWTFSYLAPVWHHSVLAVTSGPTSWAISHRQCNYNWF